MSDGMSDANAVGRLGTEVIEAVYQLRDAAKAADTGHRGLRPDSMFARESVPWTPEIDRCSKLPRRIWSDVEGQKLADDMTRELKTAQGTMRLRPVQAIALYELMQVGGLFGPIRVGAGKTLVSVIAPAALEARRPLLLLPAALLEKTAHDMSILREHWRLPTNLQLLSYEMLSLVQSADRLEYIQPDFIFADECHRFKNLRAGRTRRIVRYMNAHPETKFAAVSGTVMKSSIFDFAHLLRWCLKDNAPIPVGEDELKAWSEAIDEKVNPVSRRRSGALLDLGDRAVVESGLPPDSLPAARLVFQSRLLETPGVVASARNDGVTCSLIVSAKEYEPAPETAQHILNLKKTGLRPDGWKCADRLEVSRFVKQLALGFHGIWEPAAPEPWLATRRAWASFVRDFLEVSDEFDTELHVAQAIDAGRVGGGGTEILSAWRAIRDTFKIQPMPVWHDDTALKVCADWMENHKGIVWTRHVFFAEKLAETTGAPYYGADGKNAAGESIVHVKAGRPIIASVEANGTGRNLQMFSENLITSCPGGPSSASVMEQLLGRTHRDGQEADEVTAEILLGCSAHFDAFDSALLGARAAADTLGHDQKLLVATIAFPESIADRRGPLWV